ncbi:ankyrin repeat and BTB/POZ domain-containing protein 1 isoform X1 [Melopsittacus undulatus]|uniref:ankyrin repeat and BTB/POZ domain-containing protein 1 isoform X1 n=1 Tax=Melopsittacus undulatus TaxID=13146 RepID=UPI00146E436E|nr:ankyrin repeat and BTB/POZ domain-containing protein 1 isoform X1 [Melopsittacus undulatus]
MDTSDLFTSCKKGDVSRVRYLLEQRDVEINVRDKWDSTPLYYACLCGHEELVRYLLANGAKCEANTFDGERCLYGALSDAIRRLLKEYKQITAKCMKRDYYDVFLQRLLEQGYQSNIVFIVHGKSFCAHRCILSARSAYFAEMFETKWKGKNMIVLKHPLINPAAFGSLLQYLYTGRLDIDVEYVNDCKRLAKQCRLQDLIDDLETKCKKVYEFVSSKPGTCVKVLTIEPTGNCRLQEDLALLADCALPAKLRQALVPEGMYRWQMACWACLLGADSSSGEVLPNPDSIANRNVGFGELPFDSTDNFNSCPDVCFRVADYNFLCHKAFFCGRSDYFKALLEDHFSESEELQTQPSIPVVTLHSISEDIFIRVLYYIYSDDTELSPDNAYDVLCVADMYLLPGLKRLCGRTLAQILDEDNVVSIWRIAKLFQLTRLEDQCTEYMAKIIEKLVESEEFVAAVKENAEAVEERQETDSIPLVDDIRFHITSNVQTYSAIEEANQKLEALENLLASIGLEC